MNGRPFVFARKLLLHIDTKFTYEDNILYIGQLELVHIPVHIDIRVIMHGVDRFHDIIGQFVFVPILDTLDTLIKMIGDTIFINR